MQPAEAVLNKDPTRSYRANPAVRCPFLKSEMGAVLMMVTNILGEQSLQMAFIVTIGLPSPYSGSPFRRSLYIRTLHAHAASCLCPPESSLCTGAIIVLRPRSQEAPSLRPRLKVLANHNANENNGKHPLHFKDTPSPPTRQIVSSNRRRVNVEGIAADLTLPER